MKDQKVERQKLAHLKPFCGVIWFTPEEVPDQAAGEFWHRFTSAQEVCFVWEGEDESNEYLKQWIAEKKLLQRVACLIVSFSKLFFVINLVNIGLILKMVRFHERWQQLQTSADPLRWIIWDPPCGSKTSTASGKAFSANGSGDKKRLRADSLMLNLIDFLTCWNWSHCWRVVPYNVSSLQKWSSYLELGE